MIKTAITDMFGIDYPIICGAMMWICKPNLCAAISNAGGMGNLTAANFETEDAFRDAIRQTRELTNKPFMVNVTILPSVRITGDHHKMYLKVCAEEKVDGIEVSGCARGQGLRHGICRYAEKSRRQAVSQGGIRAPCSACRKGGV